MKDSIGIIIVNFNNYVDTHKCLQSIKPQICSRSVIVYVVDNASTDQISKKLHKLKNIKLIQSTENLGFAGGNNLAIKMALKDGCSQVVLLNNDAFFTKKTDLEELVKDNMGISAPIIRFKRFGRVIYDFGGKVDKVFGRNTHYEAAFKIQDYYPKVDYFTGACLAINVKVFRKIGYLDEKYFMYYEDADFCLRAKEANFPIRLVSSVVVQHKLSGTAKKIGAKKMSYLASSHFKFSLTHLSPISTPFVIAYNLYLRLKSM